MTAGRDSWPLEETVVRMDSFSFITPKLVNLQFLSEVLIFRNCQLPLRIGPLSRITPQGCCFNCCRFPLMRTRTSIPLEVTFQLEAGINTTGYSVSVFALVKTFYVFTISQFHKAFKKEKLWDYFTRLVSWDFKRFVCHWWAFRSTICSVSKVTKSK